MASIAIFASLQTACDSRHVIKKQRCKVRPVNSFQAKKSAHVTATDVQSKKMFQETGQRERTDNKLEGDFGEQMHLIDAGPSSVKRFDDERSINGNRDLNLFVKDGKLDWDGVITAGRAAMVGFFMAYFVDGLTGMGLVDQTSNSLCKACLLTVVVSIVLFRQTQDFGNMSRLINEFTLYDKQWKATWKDGNANNPLQQDQEPSN